MTTPPRIGIVVPHTHWDRAWYNSFEEFRVVLVDRVKRLLDLLETRPEYACFVFDGQMVPFEDYLEIHPEDRARIEAQVRAGRLVVGPWYVLPDEYLVSGEALVRNLLIGMRRAEELGRCMKAGYIPDPFGHVSQLPQILSGFGIDSAIFARGLGNASDRLGIEFEWQSSCPDISVLAVHQIGSYINLHAWGAPLREPIDTKNVNYDAAERQLLALLDQMEAARPTTKYLLLCNGMDHYPAQPVLPELIAEMNRRQTRVRLRHGSFEDFVRAVQAERPALEKCRGELHDGKHHFILSGVFSSRMPLKQENFHCQNLLESVAEPLATWAWLAGRDYPSGLLDYAWRTLMKNHPHDDICGCSTDEVHADMEPRFRHARQVGERIANRSLADMGGEPGEGLSLYVFNPHTEARDVPVVLHQNNVRLRAQLPVDGAFVDRGGRSLQGDIHLSNERAGSMIRDGDEMRVWNYDVGVALLARAVPALGVVEYRYQPAQKPKSDSPKPSARRSIRNGLLQVTVASDGSLRLHDLVSGRKLKSAHTLEHEPDFGDEYDFSPLPRARHKVTSSIGRPSTVTSSVGPLGCEMTLTGSLHVPSSRHSRRRRSTDVMSRVMYRTTVRLHANSRRIEFSTEIGNFAEDHRLRVVFPTGIRADRVFADSVFDVIERPIDLPDGAGWAQPSQPTHHAHSRVLVENGDLGFALFHRGTPEYEARSGNEGVELCLTLLRCVGMLSRSDLLTRPGGAGPEYATPDAQCPGWHHFEYALELYDGPSQRDAVLSHGCGYALGGYARLSILPKKPDIPASLLQLDGKGVELSALKKCETRDSVILRFWNTSAKKTTARLRPAFRVLAAWRTSLREERESQLAVGAKGSVSVALRPGEITTVELVPDMAAPFGYPRTPPEHGDTTRLP